MAERWSVNINPDAGLRTQSAIFHFAFSILHFSFSIPQSRMENEKWRMENGESKTPTLFHISCAFLFTLTLLLPGCSAPTEAERDNRRLVDAILTAITMKNTIWLDDDAELAEKRHLAGQLTDAEYDELTAIIEKAKSGDWQTAEKKGYEFRMKHPFVKEGH
jgi:hypothetical protein